MLRSLLVFAVLGGSVLAQTVPHARIAPVGGARRRAGDDDAVAVPNTDVKDVLSFYERLTKKRLVIDNQVQGNVSIVVAGDIAADEAIRIIETNLLLNGYVLVPVENTNIVKVVSTAKGPRTTAYPIISDEALLPEAEQVVTFLARLHYADPTDLQQTLTSFLGQGQGGYTRLTPLPKAQALLITENASTIRGLLRVIHEIDLPPAEVVSEFITLERADAKDILDKLNEIFEKTPAANGNGGGAPRVVPRQPASTPGGTQVPPDATAQMTAPGTLEIRGGALSEDSIIIGKIKLTADVRTNRIHIVTRPTNIAFTRELIQDFDSVVKFGEPVSRPLRWIPVSEVLDVVVKSITEPGMKEEVSSGSGPSSSGGSASRSKPPTSQGSGSGSLAGGGSTSSDSGGGSGGGDFAEQLSTEPVDTTPEARVIGTTKIIADKNANAIIVIGSDDVKSKVFRLLDKLDQRIPQVMLHTIIGEIDLDDKHQFGVDYILRNSGLGISPIVLNGNAANSTINSNIAGNDGTGTAAGAVGTGNAGTTSTSSVNSANGLVGFSSAQPVANLSNLINQNTVKQLATAGGSGLTAFLTAGNSMNAVVTALENNSRFRVVSRPSVFTKNNKKAIIASGQEIAVPTSIQSALTSVNSSDGIVSQSSVQFKRIALQLEVVPLINSEREVSLDILQKIDEVSGSTRIDNNDIPNIATRYVKTSVTVPNEGTLVLGGLIKQSFNKTRSGIPLLSNIPLLGNLFSNTSKEKIRSELVILIRPVVSWSPPEADQIRERSQEFLSMPADIESTIYPNGVGPAPAEPAATPQPTPAKRSGSRRR